MLRKYSEHCTIMGTIPQASVTYRRQFLDWKQYKLPAPEWDLEIIVIWNGSTTHAI